MQTIANACARWISKSGLTRREKQVLQLISRGHSNKDIARMMSICEGTVKIHVRSIFEKLGVFNRVEAAVMYCKAEFADEVLA